ncbi:hypothetical protein EIP91_009123 [Steccherinum ochraceum]|uniref:Uncharacterized protein n=1 Tax=Steccherinum ochraceum TaxID=92696 RepID=A0A4R0R218_9APHY|nr:hypothetical protein EIP91_009123 [Steccherinum ochraceum]
MAPSVISSRIRAVIFPRSVSRWRMLSPKAAKFTITLRGEYAQSARLLLSGLKISYSENVTVTLCKQYTGCTDASRASQVAGPIVSLGGVVDLTSTNGWISATAALDLNEIVVIVPAIYSPDQLALSRYTAHDHYALMFGYPTSRGFGVLSQ